MDAEEADRRMKRRERNRKSAQKCRERKLHRTQELQAQVERQRLEIEDLTIQKNALRDYAVQCVNLISEHCPGVPIPTFTCLMRGAESYPLPSILGNINPSESESIPFCDPVGSTELNFYNRTSGNENYNTTAITSTASGTTDPTGWNGRGFSQVGSPLPPLSHFVPTTTQLSTTSMKEQTRTSALWKRNEQIETFLTTTEIPPENRESGWKAENDTDSSSGCGVPPRLANSTVEVDKSL